MAAVTKRPGKFIGTHFFNPVPVMKLLEIIKGYETSEETLKIALEWGKSLGKETIVVNEAPAFAVNRILCPMLNEAFFVLGEGVASAEDIDKGMVLGCNHPIGPLALSDLVGLDTLLARAGEPAPGAGRQVPGGTPAGEARARGALRPQDRQGRV